MKKDVLAISFRPTDHTNRAMIHQKWFDLSINIPSPQTALARTQRALHQPVHQRLKLGLR